MEIKNHGDREETSCREMKPASETNTKIEARTRTEAIPESVVLEDGSNFV